jgi:transposase-like protein
MDFPIIDLMDQDTCYQKRMDLLHPEGLACPRCGAREGLKVHRHPPDSPVIGDRCQGCRRAFNLFTATAWQGAHKSPATTLLILRGIAAGTPTAKPARELDIRRRHRLELRHEIQARAPAGADRSPLPDDRAEADEMSQNAGGKTGAAHRSGRPAAAAGEPGRRPRHLGHRPAAGPRGGRPRERPALGPGGAAERGGGGGPRHGPARHQAGCDGVHRRSERGQAAGALRPRACDGQP